MFMGSQNVLHLNIKENYAVNQEIIATLLLGMFSLAFFIYNFQGLKVFTRRKKSDKLLKAKTQTYLHMSLKMQTYKYSHLIHFYLDSSSIQVFLQPGGMGWTNDVLVRVRLVMVASQVALTLRHLSNFVKGAWWKRHGNKEIWYHWDDMISVSLLTAHVMMSAKS